MFANVLDGICFVNFHKYQGRSAGIINVQKKKCDPSKEHRGSLHFIVFSWNDQDPELQDFVAKTVMLKRYFW